MDVNPSPPFQLISPESMTKKEADNRFFLPPVGRCYKDRLLEEVTAHWLLYSGFKNFEKILSFINQIK